MLSIYDFTKQVYRDDQDSNCQKFIPHILFHRYDLYYMRKVILLSNVFHSYSSYSEGE